MPRKMTVGGIDRKEVDENDLIYNNQFSAPQNLRHWIRMNILFRDKRTVWLSLQVRSNSITITTKVL